MNKPTEILLAALREGAAAGGEQRLYRSGKLPGLFSGRTSINAEIASQAVRDGLIEMVRTEVKGKATIEWVKVTPHGISFLLEQESPQRAMEELKAALESNQEGLPAWIAELRRNLDTLTQHFMEEVQTLGRRLEALAARVEGSLRRVEKLGPRLPEGAAGSLPWAEDVLKYLEKRQVGGLGEKCPLSELFANLKDKEPELTIKDFHTGLRRLHDRGALRLLTFEGADGPPEPEYALLDGASMFYFAAK